MIYDYKSADNRINTNSLIRSRHSYRQKQIHVNKKPNAGLCFLKRVRVVVFNATFNNITVISRRSALLVEGIRVPGENHRPATTHCQTLSHNVVSSTPRLSWIRTHNVSSDMHWLHRYLLIQLPYDHDHDGLFLKMGNLGNLRVFYTSSLFDHS